MQSIDASSHQIFLIYPLFFLIDPSYYSLEGRGPLDPCFLSTKFSLAIHTHFVLFSCVSPLNFSTVLSKTF